MLKVFIFGDSYLIQALLVICMTMFQDSRNERLIGTKTDTDLVSVSSIPTYLFGLLFTSVARSFAELPLIELEIYVYNNRILYLLNICVFANI